MGRHFALLVLPFSVLAIVDHLPLGTPYGAAGDVGEEVSFVQRGWSAVSVPAGAPVNGSKGPAPPGLRAGAEAKVEMIGVETRDSRKNISVRGAPGWSIRNIGAGKPWNGWLGRVKMYVEHLTEMVRKDPEQLVILVDVEDMLFGGCSTPDLLSYYRDAVAAGHGAPVVFGGGLDCFRCRRSLIDRVDEILRPRGQAAREAAGLPAQKLLYCERNHWLQSRWGSCGYSYLNGGFVMGPVGSVLKVLRGMRDLDGQLRRAHRERLLREAQGVDAKNRSMMLGKEYDDQLAAVEFFTNHPEMITIDFTGRLVLTHERIMFECRHNKPWIAVEDRHWVNTVTKTTACFVHAAGDAVGFFKEFGLLGPISPAGGV